MLGVCVQEESLLLTFPIRHCFCSHWALVYFSVVYHQTKLYFMHRYFVSVLFSSLELL